MSSFTPTPPTEDACLDFLECARYGEDSDLLLHLTSGVPTNYAEPSSGNTALHKSCANGHTSIVQILLARPDALHLPNLNGNYPLHWASSNGHAQIGALLLARFADIDVLAKNSFGKSSLTEGFTSNDTEMLQVLLEHDSAAEEKLISGAMEAEEEDENDDGSEKKDKVDSTTHVFALAPPDTNPICISVRELELKNADSPFTTEAQDDTTGLAIWAASLVCSKWIAKLAHESKFDKLDVLELGAGCGVPGLSCAVYGSPRSVKITDLNTETVNNLKHNIHANRVEYGPQTNVEGFVMDWSDKCTWPDSKVDVLIGADLVYTSDIVPLLKSVVSGLLKDNGVFYYCAPDTGRSGLAEFVNNMKLEYDVVVLEAEGTEFVTNPLASGDGEMLMIHFNEYFEKKFFLYEFKMRAGR